MKIPEPDESLFADIDVKEELREFIQQPSPQELAPCSGCMDHQPNSCSSKCVRAPESLSIDPILHPIEYHVVPIVYELMATRLIQTCWSCEGHMNEKDELWKLPQVCFYTPSAVYVKLLSRHLSLLNHNKNLAYPWHIVISEICDTCKLVYSIQPNLNDADDPHLGLMQNDLNVIGENLHGKLKLYAQEFITVIK